MTWIERLDAFLAGLLERWFPNGGVSGRDGADDRPVAVVEPETETETEPELEIPPPDPNREPHPALRRIVAEHRDGGSGLPALERALDRGEAGQAVWEGLRCGLVDAADRSWQPALLWDLPQEDEWIVDFFRLWSAGVSHWAWFGDPRQDVLQRLLDAMEEPAHLARALAGLREPGRSQAAHALWLKGILTEEELPPETLDRAARAYLDGYLRLSGGGHPCLADDRWPAILRQAALSSKDRYGDALEQALPGATLDEASRLLANADSWRLGDAVVRRFGAPSKAYLERRADEVLASRDGRWDRCYGWLGLLLALAELGTLEERFDPLLARFLEPHPICGELGRLLRGLPEPRREALLLASAGDDRLPPWSLLETCPTPAIRRIAVDAAARTRKPRELDDRSPEVRALIRLAGTDALVEKALEDVPGRAALVAALAYSKRPEAETGLEILAQDGDREVRDLARWGLEQLRPSTSDDALAAAADVWVARTDYPRGLKVLNEAAAESPETAERAGRLMAAGLLGRAPTESLAMHMQALPRVHFPLAEPLAAALVDGLEPDHPHALMLYGWAAPRAAKRPASEAALRRALDTAEGEVAALLRQALGEEQRWPFEADLPDDPIDRFARLTAVMNEVVQWGGWLAFLRHVDRDRVVVTGYHRDPEEQERPLRLIGPMDEGVSVAERLVGLTRALQPSYFVPLDLEPRRDAEKAFYPFEPEAAVARLVEAFRFDGPDRVKPRDEAMARAVLREVRALGADLYGTEQQLLDAFYDRGVLFCSPDGGCLGLVWYINDQ